MTLPCGLPSRPLADEDQEDEESSHHVEAAEAAKQDLEIFFGFFAIISVAFKRPLWLSGSVCAYQPLLCLFKFKFDKDENKQKDAGIGPY